MTRSRWRMRITVALVVVLSLAIVVVSYDLVANAGRIHRGVSVGGVAVGGKRQAEAAKVLDRGLSERASEPVVLSALGKSASVTATQVAASYDTTSLVQAAYSYGRTGHFLKDVGDRIRAAIVSASLPASPTADEERLTAVVGAFAREVDAAAKDASVVINGTQVDVKPSSKGRAVDLAEAKRLVLQAFTKSDRTVKAPVVTTTPAVSDSAAQKAAEDARAMLSAEVEIAYDSDRWQFSPGAIAGWISFVRSDEASAATGAATAASATATDAEGTASGGTAVSLVAYVDPVKARKLILPTIGAVGRPSKDASFKVSGGQVNIVPSQDGVGPDVEALARELTIVLKDPERARSVALRTRRVPAKITTAKAQSMGIRERISRYTTTYSASNKPRVSNIHTLADAIDGTLIAPGGTFSFNDTVGPRTAAKGYQEAPAIVDGKLVPQLGGGICQVGTTLFNTVFESGLPVVERHNHSFYISHYPRGRDATVSWGGPDLKFKNDTAHWLLLVTGYSDSSLTIALYGTNPGYEVESVVGAWENERPYGTEETKDPTLPQGARVVEDGGVTGRSITVKRIVSRNGAVMRTDEFRSVYRPKVEVVRVGTKPRSKPATTTVSPRP